MNDKPDNKDIYTGFARGYDRVMEDVDYEGWARYILRVLKAHRLKAARILNLACGTGNAEAPWAQAGYSIVGIDQSQEMINIARTKNPPQADIQYLVGDMRSIELGEEFDLIVCLYDSLNYLTCEEDVRLCFESVAAHLRKGGAFVFDIATEKNILENFTNITYAENFDDFAYIWENEYNLRTKICKSDFHFFYRDNGSASRFERFSETHYQRIYSSRELIRWLRDSGLIHLGSYDGFTTDPPTAKSERVHFLAQKV